MRQDIEELCRINREISDAEDRGDVALLAGHLAPTLAFRRASGTLANRDELLASVKPSGPRTTEIQSVVLLGQTRALVTCIISMPVGGELKRYDNARLFIRSEVGEWRLMGWANEALERPD